MNFIAKIALTFHQSEENSGQEKIVNGSSKYGIK